MSRFGRMNPSQLRHFYQARFNGAEIESLAGPKLRYTPHKISEVVPLVGLNPHNG